MIENILLLYFLSCDICSYFFCISTNFSLTDCLTGLIDAAHEQNVEFVYALSPGLDITYSSTKDVTALKRKLEQVIQFSAKLWELILLISLHLICNNIA